MDRASRNGARRGNGHSHDQRVGKPRQFIASRRRSPVGRGAARDRVHRNRGDRRPNVGRGGRTRLAAPPGAQDRYTGFRTRGAEGRAARSEERTSELQSLMRISYAVFCLKKKTHKLTENKKETNN